MQIFMFILYEVYSLRSKYPDSRLEKRTLIGLVKFDIVATTEKLEENWIHFQLN